METARITFDGSATPEIIEILKENIGLRHERHYGNATFFVGETYSFWRDSEIMGTAILFEEENRTTVEVFSGGGKDNIWGMSRGGERKFLDKIIDPVSKYCEARGLVPKIEIY